MIYFTSTYYKILKIKEKIKVIQGGQGAGKNVAIAQILIKKAAEKQRVITVMTDTYDNLKDGAIKDFHDQFDAMGWDWEAAYNKSGHDLTIGKSIVQFRYVSDSRKSTGKSKRRDILYINEANKIGWETAATYIGRTHEEVYIDFNPDFEFWVHTEVPKLKDKETGKPLSKQIIVIYPDNEMLPQSEIDYIESRKDNKEWYRVYGLGQTGFYTERQIYQYQEIEEIPKTAKRKPSGMDFGQSPGKTSLIDIFEEGANLYIDEVFSMNNLMPEKIRGAERMSIVDQMDFIKFPHGQLIVADSSGATEIKDLKKYRYNITGVHKKQGGQINGINKLRGYNLFITKRSVNTMRSADSWFWKVDKSGNIIPEPDGHEPDEWAAIRYAVNEKSRPKVY